MKRIVMLCLVLSALCTTAFADKGTVYLGQVVPYTVEEFTVPENAETIDANDADRELITGNTCGQGNDYQFNCEYTYTDLAEDVAYNLTVTTAGQFTFDLCASSFDTRIGIFDSAGNLIYCNDDACGFVPSPPLDPGPYASKIECCALAVGEYTVVIDGYSEFDPQCGDYVLEITVCDPGCTVECPTSALPEPEVCGEEVNSGCNSVPPSWSPISCNSEVCGTAYAADGTRDVDFYQVHLDAPAILTWCVTAEYPVAAAILDPTADCGFTNIYDLQEAAECVEICATSPCLPAGDYWLFTAPQTFYGVACSDYHATLTCTPCGDCVGTEEVVFQPGTGAPPSQCVDLCLNQLLPIYVCPGGPFPPIVYVREGCFWQEPGCDIECPPATFSYDPDAWTIDPTTGCWVNEVSPLSDGCACVSFDGFLPVELLSFSATAGDARVMLSWETASETNNDRFEILRDGAQIAALSAQGSGAEGHRYSYLDDQVENGATYQYALVAVDVSGAREEIGTASATPTEEISIVNEYALYQNYPNPFNPTTTIAFDLAENGLTTLAIYNMMGQEVATLLSSNLEAGHHTVSFDGSSLPSGTYWYRLTAGEFSAVKKMLLMK